MQTHPVNIPIYLDIDKTPISEQLGFPFLQYPTDIRWAGKALKRYRVTGMPNIYCDSGLFLLDRTQEEVQIWLRDKHDLDSMSSETVQKYVKKCSDDDLLPLVLSPLAFSEVNGAASWMHFDIGLERPLSLNAEAYSWLSREGYAFYYQPGKRKSGVMLKRRSAALAGVLMPGDIDLTIRQIYMKALKSSAIFDHTSVCDDGTSDPVGRQLTEDEHEDDRDSDLYNSAFRSCRRVAKESFAIIENKYECNRYSHHAIYTGFTDVDHLLGGFACGSIVVVAGDTVSSFLSNIVRKNAGRLKKPVSTAVICLQKAIPEIGIQLICMAADLVLRDIRKGLIKVREWTRLASGAGKFSDQYPLYFSDRFPTTIDDLAERVRALKSEKPQLRLIILDSLEMITGDDNVTIGNGLRLLKKLADDLSIVIIIGSSSNIRFKQNKRNFFERYADAILLLRKNEQNYTAEIITHEEDDTCYDYDDKLRGVVKISTGNTVYVKYPVEVQVRNSEGLFGSAILQYIPQKGVFVNGK